MSYQIGYAAGMALNHFPVVGSLINLKKNIQDKNYAANNVGMEAFEEDLKKKIIHNCVDILFPVVGPLVRKVLKKPSGIHLKEEQGSRMEELKKGFYTGVNGGNGSIIRRFLIEECRREENRRGSIYSTETEQQPVTTNQSRQNSIFKDSVLDSNYFSNQIPGKIETEV